MKTTLELTYEELELICQMSSRFVDDLDMRIFKIKQDIDRGIGTQESNSEYIKSMESRSRGASMLWEKVEKTKNGMIRGTK